ncbi:hypothetical protein [Thiothrix fructosivorans]|uniref:Uncharacterized protein n=1 Tax=Thiothrix fructosivorans TaxID=111770 RepID=A0A8B0SJI1_9GAMM|nr:hypothetical protein [Thiothrix fructosivorans]MBO0611720.1 hypothetical protein [Thiothrix fructosivorans]QTX10620.1 hypothetical protein J1836_018980 [Thiothrix fructosivorans]
MTLLQEFAGQQAGLLKSEIDTRFAGLMKEAEDQFTQIQDLHQQRMDAYAAERDALKAVIDDAFGVSGDTG